ncbi:hypothetical protein NP493_553g02000 [Ridgeia piscesae]|uniref:Mitochondrial import receptor subunit TOM22 homolog n=1 Tax=Ridgeia piscesae TaxID=27915 RepID=A0AAD9NPQ5_RIDPI|nr:hypothetical protein NP493_553g02000 [Ridgeia piscesae]
MSADDILGAMGEPSATDASNPLLAESTDDSSLGPVSLLKPTQDEDDFDELQDIDETLAERLWGLTEMFPECVRNATSGVVGMSGASAKWLYQVGRVGVWVIASSAAILAFPIMFETERAQMEEQQVQQQRQILLGPNAAVAGSGMGAPGMMGAMPPLTAGPPGSIPR